MSEAVRLARGLCLPRRGVSANECEDCWVIDPPSGRFAVADGASESYASATWARLLVQYFTRSPSPWPDWIPEAQTNWIAEVAGQDDGLPWFLEQRHRDGAFATFLGVTVHNSTAQVVAVGDSCLFHLRKNALLRSFPLMHSRDFTSTPWLVGSRTSPDVPRREGLSCQMAVLPGDDLWLMTDALACWFLREAESGGQPWQVLNQLLDEPDSWVGWVEAQRQRRELRDDDTTLVAIGL